MTSADSPHFFFFNYRRESKRILIKAAEAVPGIASLLDELRAEKKSSCQGGGPLGVTEGVTEGGRESLSHHHQALREGMKGQHEDPLI